jgi:tetratricopeptide (TPR) repeat protein
MMELTLKQRILNELDNGEKGFSDKIAKLAGYSSGSALRKVLTDDKKEFGKFLGLVKVVRELFPKEEKRLMTEFSLSVDVNKKSARYMLEYLNFNYMYDELNKLIDLMKNAANVESREWGKLYEIDQMVVRKELSPSEALTRFSQVNVKSDEMEICLEIMKAYSFFDIQKYDMAVNFVYPILDEIEKIKEEYIKDIFLGRSLSLLAECEIRLDNVDLARKYCQRTLKEVYEDNFKVRAYLTYGNSYIISDFDKAMELFDRALKLNSDKRITIEIKRSMNFTCNYWGREIPFSNITDDRATDLHEKAFEQINKNNIMKANEILDSIDFDQMNENEKGFHYFLKGMVSKSIEDFSKSVINFKLSGDRHFVKLPLIELQKQGVNEMLLNAMLV